LWVGKVPSSQKYQELFFSLSMSIGGIVLTTINVVKTVSYTIPNHSGGIGYTPNDWDGFPALMVDAMLGGLPAIKKDFINQ